MELSNQEIRNILLTSAYEQRQRGWLTVKNILAKTDLDLKHQQLENHLLILCDEGLLEEKPKRLPIEVFDPDRRTSQMRTHTEYKFQITPKGEHFIDPTLKAGD